MLVRYFGAGFGNDSKKYGGGATKHRGDLIDGDLVNDSNVQDSSAQILCGDERY
jgi:hypothetical protein